MLAANLLANRLTVVFGPTGVGKSSLLRAGVASSLRQRHEQPVVVFTDWRSPDPLGELNASIASELRRMSDQSSPAVEDQSGLVELIARSWPAGSPLAVILDQVEEYFSYHSPRSEAGKRFDAQLAIAVNRLEVNAHFLLAVREDRLAGLDRFSPRIANVFGNAMPLRPLSVSAAREAIEAPLMAHNAWLPPGSPSIAIEPALVDEVLHASTAGHWGLPAEDEREIEPAYLQIVLHRLWEEEAGAGSRTLRVQTLIRLGGGMHIARDVVNRSMGSLTKKQQDVAAAMFAFLVTPSGTKVAFSARDIGAYANVRIQQVEQVLAILADLRIVRVVAPQTEDRAPRYEIFHNVLAEPILDWRKRHTSHRRNWARRVLGR